ncbi:hypothetical protein LguiA_017011 [Lonicera macranthoides]
MIKLRSKIFSRSNSKLRGGDNGGCISLNGRATKGYSGGAAAGVGGEIKWELRPGGMLVQKRENGESTTTSSSSSSSVGEEMIVVKVSTISQCHNISIQPTSTFGELKMMISMVTGLEPKEQRVLYKGKEREDGEYLHMVGVRDKDKVLLLEDPAIKETKLKLHGLARSRAISTSAAYRTISV